MDKQQNLGASSQTQNFLPLGKFSLEKKKSVNFHTFGLNPPPLPKKCETLEFIFHTLTETYFGKKNWFFHL